MIPRVLSSWTEILTAYGTGVLAFSTLTLRDQGGKQMLELVHRFSLIRPFGTHCLRQRLSTNIAS